MTTGKDALAGNGVLLVRERAIARSVQTALERLYRIDEGPSVDSFLMAADEDEREALFLRQTDDGLEIAVRLPTLPENDDGSLDRMCQIIEGVSHFVMVTERARADRATTHLELELQAEVDKYVVLATAIAKRDGAFDEATSNRLRAQLYEGASFTHESKTEVGDRYRLASRAAASFVRKLARAYATNNRIDEMRSHLRRFFSGNQEEKLRLAAA
ncbi:MAG TPA: hypothetical protein VF407_17720 [Polyangiaceae bacterium]